MLFTCNYVVSVWRGFLFLWVLGMGYTILLWHFMSLPYNYFDSYYCNVTQTSVNKLIFFFRCFFSMFSLSMLCLFYVLAFVCFVVLFCHRSQQCYILALTLLHPKTQPRLHAICDLVHNVETIFHISHVLTASGNLF